MKLVLKLEELAMWIGCVGALYWFNAGWWWYPILLLAPDISMLGYLFGNMSGSWCYNFFHHKGIAVFFSAIGILLSVYSSTYSREFFFCGIALFGHSSMDRFFGYGLKYENGFKFTHLGEIGKKSEP